MAIRRSPITPQFTWDDAAGQYRNARGEFVPRLEVRRAIASYLENKSAQVRDLAGQLQRREISTADWQRQMEKEVARVHLASAAAAKGGWHALGQSDYGRVGQQVREEYRRLRKFGAQIENGLPLDGRFTNRAGQYAQAGRATYENFQRREMEVRGHDEERSVRNASDSCDGCMGAAGQGWQPIGSLPLPGTRDCLRNCKCAMEYRQSVTTKETKEQQNPHDEVLPPEQQTEAALERLAGRLRNYMNRHFDTKSAWNGKINLNPAFELGAAGRFEADGSISLALEVAEMKASQVNTIFHELFHSIESKRELGQYARYKGWIEGTLEQMLRTIRPQMLEELGIEVSAAANQWRDENHLYNPFVRALEGIRVALGYDDAEAFYAILFATPDPEKSVKIRELAAALPDQQRRHVEQTLNGAFKVLGGE